MKKAIFLQAFLFTALVAASPVFAQAQSADVAKIQNFIESIIGILTTVAAFLAAGFFVWGGIGYITSSGNPENLDRSKKTIATSAIGLAIVLGSYVLMRIVVDLAQSAFGK